ncbi:NAD(P)/FAD-dependent oxidoreductase [Anaeroselena agilis]|uniref:NADH:ubiquinone reductase (non-electrogenic) n=1 Tax=Anaeroselena agilis TaxID=3063788 RepID=A0ABU3P093_9FIRM|nr:NAD(P)/FAD-dependent oxidoreductase [Selenomonadales bacterium 4137-cl]
MTSNNPPARANPAVVIVGGGFAGLQAAKALSGEPLDVILLDRNNYHLFQPLLYQVATAGLGPEDISYPLRAILRGYGNVAFRMADVCGVDLAGRRVLTDGGAISYDYLLLAVGAETSFFGLESVAANAVGLKNLADALTLRNHILRMFELASREQDPAIRRELLTFVVAGGGATGVESAGGLAELVHLVLAKDYPELDFAEVSLILLEGGDRLLLALPASLAAYAARALRKMRVEIRFRSRVAGFDSRTITLADGAAIAARTIVWAAGVKAAALIATLGVPADRLGRAIVAETLQLPGHPEVFVAGDAACREQDGGPLPMIAPVAVQQAILAAANIAALAAGRQPAALVYKDPGTLATIGRSTAVAAIGRWRFAGFTAWLLWLVIHLIRLVGFRNRFIVTINWAWDYFFYERAIRLILRI